MNVGAAARALEALAPLALAEPWDNVGLLVGDPEAEARGLLFAIDLSAAVVAEAVERGAGLVVAYHPPVFPSAKAFAAPSPAYLAARAGLSVWTPHTALDAAAGGTNDALAEVLGLSGARPLRPHAAEPGVGQGRVGALSAPLALDALAERVKAALGLGAVLVAAPPAGRPVGRVAVAAGAGGDLVDAALRAGAEALVTGELSHHKAREAAAAGLAVVATLHSNSERPGLAALARRAGERIGLACAVSARDLDPFAPR